MLVIPLGLGTKLRRIPIVTLAVAGIWLGVGLFDRTGDRVTDAILVSVAKRDMREASRRLFREYCESRRGHSASCRRYAQLIWTGFPSKRDLPALSKASGSMKERIYDLGVAEYERATKIREQLNQCRESRRCFVYKDIIWRFLDAMQHDASRLAHLKSYAAYKSAVTGYRRDLSRICQRYDCLVPANVNAASLVSSQLRHGGWLHLMANLIALLIFGMYVEQRSHRLIYLATLIGGGTAGMALHALYFGTADVLVLGGSANVSAVAGMFFVFFFHKRMRFQVLLPRKLYLGTPFYADVKYCFPILFILADIAGAIDSGFGSLTEARVAHAAHLSGLLVGMIVALIVSALRRLPRCFLYEDEVHDMLALESARDMGEILDRAEAMLAYNPDNVHAMEAAVGAYLRWIKSARSYEDRYVFERGRAFVAHYLPAVCAINTRHGELRYACKLLSQMPLYMPLHIYLTRLGQLSILKLGDYALQEGHPILALRLYDLYLMRFPISIKGRAVEETCAGIIAALIPSRENQEVLRTFLAYHPETLLGPRMGAWLTNVGQQPLEFHSA